MPITDYFGKRQEEAAKRNHAFLEKLSNEKRRQMLEAEKEGKAVYAKRRQRDILHDEGILSILNLHRSGYGNYAIALMLEISEDIVWNNLQIPLLRHIAGARDVQVLKANKKHRVWPRYNAILAELDLLGMDVEQWEEMMMNRHGASKIVMNRLLGRRKDSIPIAAALMVVEYFGGNADEYFAETKEKAAE